MLNDYFSQNIEKYPYKARDFLNNLKVGLAPLLSPNEIYNKKVKNKVLSLLLGEKESHIHSKILNKIDISLEQLESYLSNLKTLLKRRGIIVPKYILELFEKFKNKNKLKLYKYGSVLDRHPDFDLQYFKKIDTIEKAYWLGWLFVEGWLSLVKHGGKPYIECGVGCSREDAILIINFIKIIGFNPKFIEYHRPKKDFVRIRISFSRMDFPNTLFNLGWKPGKKAQVLKLPDLGDINTNRHLYLAFLLGYFDGDGTQGTSEIISASKKFLDEIKSKFYIMNEVRQFNTVEHYHEGSFFKKSVVWRLTLGAELFNKMLNNYKSSLPRKRIRLEEHHERIERLRSFAKSRLKFMFKKEDLEKLVWHMTYEEIAILHFELFNIKITERTVKKWVYIWQTNRPSLRQMAQIRKLGKRSPIELYKIYYKLETSKI